MRRNGRARIDRAVVQVRPDFGPATLLVALAIGSVLAVMAYLRVAEPRHDAWQPEELSRLAPPFPSPTNGVRHVV